MWLSEGPLPRAIATLWWSEQQRTKSIMKVASLNLKPSTSRKNLVCFSTSALLITTWVSLVGRERSSIASAWSATSAEIAIGWPSGELTRKP